MDMLDYRRVYATYDKGYDDIHVLYMYDPITCVFSCVNLDDVSNISF